MMKRFNLIIVGLMFAVSAYWYPRLPAMVPMHWNIRGEVDNFVPKGTAAWLLPLMTLVMFGLFQILPAIDPKKENYRLFKREWEIIQTSLIGFFAYMQGIIFYAALTGKTQITSWMFLGIGSLLILLGNYLSKIRQNYFIGYKLPWTLASEDNWNKTHRYASWWMVGAGILIMIEATIFWNAPGVVFGSLMLATIMPIIYSFLLYKQKLKYMKYVYWSLGLVLVGLILVRGVSGEDDWLCQNGQWMPHGNPSAPIPTSVCE